MKIITERDMIKSAITNFTKAYGLGTYGGDKRGIQVGYELSKLDTQVCTSEEVNSLIGSDWTSVICHECNKIVKEAISLCEELPYENLPVYICKDCLTKALSLFGEPA